MGLLTREGLLAKEQLEVVKVDLGDGQHVFVRQMTGRERESFELTLVEIQEPETPDGRPTFIPRNEHFRAKLAVHTVCDAEGNLILGAEDYETLNTNISAKRLEAIVNVAQELNRISDEDRENLLKN